MVLAPNVTLNAQNNLLYFHIELSDNAFLEFEKSLETTEFSLYINNELILSKVKKV